MHIKNFKWALLTLFVCGFISPLSFGQEGICFVLEESTYEINGEKVSMDAKSFAMENRIYVPVRYLAEALGAELQLDEALGEIHLKKGDQGVRLLLHGKTGFVNGRPEWLEASPKVIEGRTYLPARFVAEAFGYEVIWEGASRSTKIVPRTRVSALSQKEIRVSNVKALEEAVAKSNEGHVTILIEDGHYQLSKGLYLKGDHISLKSASGNRDKVVLTGDFKASHIFWIAGKDIEIRDLSLGEVYHHGIQVHGELGAENISLRNLRFFDCKEQLLKGSGNATETYSKNVWVEGCLFEFTKGEAFQYYTGGIDVHRGDGWVVENNTFRGIVSPENRLSEGAIHFWSGSRDTIIENNNISNCDRGIMLGFDRSYHYGGLVRNNKIHVVRDTGIYLANAENARVENNTVYVDSAYPNAIEYRFNGTRGTEIRGNQVNKAIKMRDGAVALLLDNLILNLDKWW